MLLRSEFGRVRVALEETRNGARLMVEDERTSQRIYLDPLELECLAASRHRDLVPLLNPGRFTDLVEAAEGAAADAADGDGGRG